MHQLFSCVSTAIWHGSQRQQRYVFCETWDQCHLSTEGHRAEQPRNKPTPHTKVMKLWYSWSWEFQPNNWNMASQTWRKTNCQFKRVFKAIKAIYSVYILCIFLKEDTRVKLSLRETVWGQDEVTDFYLHCWERREEQKFAVTFTVWSTQC